MAGNELIGKKVRILFEDLGRSSSKVGVVVSQDNSFVQIKTNMRIEFIPVSKIIRIEELNEDYEKWWSITKFLLEISILSHSQEVFLNLWY